MHRHRARDAIGATHDEGARAELGEVVGHHAAAQSRCAAQITSAGVNDAFTVVQTVEWSHVVVHHAEEQIAADLRSGAASTVDQKTAKLHLIAGGTAVRDNLQGATADISRGLQRIYGIRAREHIASRAAHLCRIHATRE